MKLYSFTKYFTSFFYCSVTTIADIHEASTSNINPVELSAAHNKDQIPSDVNETIDQVIRDYMVDEDNENEAVDAGSDINWHPVTGNNLKTFDFTVENVGIKPSIYENYADKLPIDFFLLFVDDEILQVMVTETNRYATQNLTNPELEAKARIRQWKNTNPYELKQFLGVLIWMGLVQMPHLHSYWSKKKIYSNYVKKIMSRNRFQLLLSMWHFSDNEDFSDTSKLRKLSPLLNHLKSKYQSVIVPEQNICIDETLVPFRGRLAFRQYIKNKRHKFGIKLFKLCTKGGYTYNLSVYCGKEGDNQEPVPTRVVKNLLADLLDKGYILYTDNYYTSVSLAHKLLAQNTHLVGTLRKNRKYNPKDVIDQKLNKGDTIARESNTGVIVSKWKDKRDVLMLSTKHVNENVTVQTRNTEVLKPKVVVDYNNSKAFIDLSDQLKSYNSSLRRGIKWYRKLAIEMLLGTSIVNAHMVYSAVTTNKISITSFKEILCEQLLDINKFDNIAVPDNGEKHILEETENRRRCVECYRKLSESEGRKAAQRKSKNIKLCCSACKKNYCMPCFFEVHQCTK